jgi:chromosome segregation ATPase
MPALYDPEDEITHLRKQLAQKDGQILALAGERDGLRRELMTEKHQRRRAEEDVTSLTGQLQDARKACRVARTEQHAAQSAINFRKEGYR